MDIRAIAEQHGVVYHHHDSFDTPRYANGEDDDLRNAIHVVYSESFGSWRLAINVDGSISKPGDSLMKKNRRHHQKNRRCSC